MSLFNTKIMTVKRVVLGDYTSSPDGSYTEGAAVPDFTVTGSWQPATGTDQKALPEGKRSSSVFKVYTSTELRVVNQLTQQAGDHIVSPLDGLLYEINSAGSYQNDLIPHFKYLAVRIKESA